MKINRPKAITASYLYSEGRTAKILGVKVSQIEFIMLLDDGNVLVGLFNDSIKIPLERYIEDSVEERKGKAVKERLWSVKKNNNSFSVVNNRKSKYQVNLVDDHLECNCKDYDILSKIFSTKNVCCKHNYAVLSQQLGCSSLKDYIKTVCAEGKTL